MVKYKSHSIQHFHDFREEITHFIYHNDVVFEWVFAFLYMLEQGCLLLATYLDDNPHDVLLFVSLFTLVFALTFSYHKLILDSRARSLEKNLNALRGEMNLLISDFEHLASHQSTQNKPTQKASINIYQKRNNGQRGDLYGKRGV